ncbi:MAG: ABC transporter permease [Gemmatimonadaceae bacterium]
MIGSRLAIRSAARSLLRKPALPIAVVAILSLGMAVTTAIFSVVNALMLRPLPYPESEKLVQIWSALPATGVMEGRVSYPRFEAYQAQTAAFAGLGAYWEQDFNLTGGSTPIRVIGARASATLFPLLGVTPVRGRLFTQDEDRPGGANVAVISERLWTTRFGSAPDIVGRSVSLDGVPVTVVGVLPASFAFGSADTDLWLPRVFEPGALPQALIRLGAGYLNVVGRLRPDADLARADSDLRAISERYRSEFASHRDAAHEPQLVRLSQQLRGETGRSLTILWVAAMLVFLIACANAGNLLLARHVSRRDELALHEAVGANRLQLVGMLTAECLLLAGVATIVGLLLAFGLLRAAAPLTSAAVPGFAAVRLDPVVLLSAFVALCLTLAVAGLLPAWLTTSRRTIAPPGMLRLSATATRGAARGRRLFAGAQVAVSFVLLVAAAQLFIALLELQRTDMGFEPSGALTMQLAPAAAKYPTLESQQQFYRAMEEQLAAIPGVSAVGAIQILPTIGDHRISFVVEGRPEPKPEERPLAQFSIATPGVFPAMEIALRRGRLPTEADRQGTPPVIVVNETFARRVFPGEDAVGRRLTFGPIPGSREIVGVVSDVRQQGPATEAVQGLYIPVAQFFARLPPMFLVVRAGVPPASLAPNVRQAAAKVDPDQPLAQVQSMESALRNALAVPRLRVWLVAVFAALGTLIAIAGVYSVISYVVAERTREFDIRLALGATPRSVAGLVLRATLAMTVGGLVAGAIAAFVGQGLIRRVLAETAPAGPALFLSVAGILLIANLLAAIPSSLRAARLRTARLLQSA